MTHPLWPGHSVCTISNAAVLPILIIDNNNNDQALNKSTELNNNNHSSSPSCYRVLNRKRTKNQKTLKRAVVEKNKEITKKKKSSEPQPPTFEGNQIISQTSITKTRILGPWMQNPHFLNIENNNYFSDENLNLSRKHNNNNNNFYPLQNNLHTPSLNNTLRRPTTTDKSTDFQTIENAQIPSNNIQKRKFKKKCRLCHRIHRTIEITVECAQKSPHSCIPSATFERIVRNYFSTSRTSALGLIQDKHINSLRIKREAINALQAGAEAHLTQFLRLGNIIGEHAKRKTLMYKDLILAQRLGK